MKVVISNKAWAALLILLCVAGIGFAAEHSVTPSISKKGEFKLENYKTAEEAQATLLKLHPIGSQTISLLGEFDQYAKLVTHKNSKKGNEILIQFKERPSNYAFSKIIETEWVIIIQDRDNTIISITVKKYLTGP